MKFVTGGGGGSKNTVGGGGGVEQNRSQPPDWSLRSAAPNNCKHTITGAGIIPWGGGGGRGRGSYYEKVAVALP